MFTGIIEEVGIIKEIKELENKNLVFKIHCSFIDEVYHNQSIAHDGVCLSVKEINNNTYSVELIEETIDRTKFKNAIVGDNINLERSLKLSDRLDGHLVQGHIDTTGKCVSKTELEGSTVFRFTYEGKQNLIEKGSITINGVSLTVFNIKDNSFEVACIPHTLDNTNFKNIIVKSNVNLEFDLLVKYIQKLTNN